MLRTSETEHARFTLAERDLLEVRLRAGVHINIALIAAVMRERIRLCGTGPLCIMVLVPVDAELDIAVMGLDHYKVNESAEGIRAVAIASGALSLATMARLYAAYYPPTFRLEVFGLEVEARTWIGEQLELLRQAGQQA